LSRRRRIEAPGRFRLRITPAAQEVREQLRGRSATKFEALQAALKAEACKAGGYRLLARDGEWSEFCCIHLDREWRVILTFDAGGTQIVHVGRHDGPEFYASLSSQYDIDDAGQKRDQKPACCGDDGWPSVGLSRLEKRGSIARAAGTDTT
jgi:plasmid maintenance system killer protein